MAAKSKKKRSPASGDVVTNRRARHKFEFVETMEAGIVLTGSEVKALRGGQAQMTDSYAVVDDGEVSGVIRAGAFVAFGGELGDVYEGMLPARTLPGGRYELDRQEVSLTGSGDGATALRLGDPVRVRVTGVDAGRGRVDLELTGGGGKRDNG